MARKKKKLLQIHTMTKGGAGSMMKFYRDSLKCEIVEEPKLHTDGVQWTFTVTDPFPEHDDV